MKYKVINYRYGMPIGSIIPEDEVVEDKMRFLELIVEKKKATKKKVAKSEEK